MKFGRSQIWSYGNFIRILNWRNSYLATSIWRTPDSDSNIFICDFYFDLIKFVMMGKNKYCTLQKFRMCSEINCSEKRFRICYIVYYVMLYIYIYMNATLFFPKWNMSIKTRVFIRENKVARQEKWKNYLVIFIYKKHCKFWQ